MALPKLNDTPKFEVSVPSTGKKVRFRPYLVKEEKVLMLAFESGDRMQTLNAITDTIASCVDPTDNLDINKLTTFDVEYLFTNIRSKSVGEVAKIRVKCTECDVFNDQEIDLEDIEIKVPKDNVIKLTDDVSVKMVYPSYKSVIEKDIDDEDTFKLGFEVIQECVDSVLTNDERISLKDESKEDVENFFNSFTTDQFSKIVDYLSNMPKLQHKMQFTCVNCQHENDVVLEGMSDFF